MQQKSSVHAFLPFRPPKYAALAHGRGTGVVRPKAGACGVLSGSLSEGISWVILAFFVGCVKAGGSGARCAARGGGCAAERGSAGGLQRGCFQRFTPRGGLAAARRGGALLASGPGSSFLRAAPRRVAAARRDGALLVSGPGNRFFRAAPRGGAGGCVAERSSAGGLQRRVFSPLCAARGAALARGPRGAAAAFLASLTRR